MGLFDLFKRPKTEQEQYYEEYDRHQAQNVTFTAPPVNSYQQTADTGSFSMEGFRITVEDVFSITGRGTVITGRIASGTIHVGDTVTLHRVDGSYRPVVVVGIEMFRKSLNSASIGDNVGLLIRGVTKADIGRGDVLMR